MKNEELTRKTDRSGSGKTGKSNSRGGSKYSGKRGTSAKDGRKPLRTEASKMDTRSTNHIGWYVSDPNQFSNAANIYFSNRVGDPIVDAALVGGSATTSGGRSKFYMPGIMNVRFTPTYGELYEPDSPGNVASNAVYSWVRHANSGSRNYDAVDLMLYLLAMDNVYMGITWLQRMIGIVMMYNRWNTYTPGKLLAATGVNEEGIGDGTIYGDLAAMRYRLNNIILKATTLAVPNALPIYERHAYMCSSIYVDEPNEMGQFYIFSPVGLWRFELDDRNAGSLKFVKFDQYIGETIGTFKWTHYFDLVESLIDAIYTDEDAGIMSGDILKAYGPESLVKLATIPDDMVVVPIYDHEMLVQIHNATIWGGVDTLGSHPAVIKQVIPDDSTSPYLTMDLELSGKLNGLAVWPDFVLDLHMDPTNEAVMRSTRLMAYIFSETEDLPIDHERSSYATEIVNAVTIYTYMNSTDDQNHYEFVAIPAPKPFKQSWMDPQFYKYVWAASTFTLAPMLYVPVMPRNADPVTYDYYPMSRFDRWTVMPVENLRRLNETAVLACFNVPRLSLGRTMEG